jgi:hypothetical protein
MAGLLGFAPFFPPSVAQDIKIAVDAKTKGLQEGQTKGFLVALAIVVVAFVIYRIMKRKKR